MRCLVESRGPDLGGAEQHQARDLKGRWTHHRWVGSCQGKGAAGWELAVGGQGTSMDSPDHATWIKSVRTEAMGTKAEVGERAKLPDMMLS